MNAIVTLESVQYYEMKTTTELTDSTETQEK